MDTGSLTCVRDSYGCIYHYMNMIYTHWGWAHRQQLQVSTTFLTQKNSQKFFLCSWWGWNLRSLDLESDAVPMEPPRHPTFDGRLTAAFLQPKLKPTENFFEWSPVYLSGITPSENTRHRTYKSLVLSPASLRPSANMACHKRRLLMGLFLFFFLISHRLVLSSIFNTFKILP